MAGRAGGRGKWKGPRKTKEELRGEVQQALQSIEDGVVEVVTGDDWRKMLQYSAKFHNYSFGNMMLIKHQMPGATRVAGFHAWKRVGRYVKAGQHGLRILAPMYKVKVIEDEDGEEKKTKISFFRLVSVFDVSQTEGEPVPGVTQLLGGKSAATDWAFAQASKWLKRNGFKVAYESGLGETGGYWDASRSLIAINDERAPAHQARTLIHETAHLILHTAEEYRRIDVQRRLGKNVKEREINEVEAESVAFVVMNVLGVPAGQYSFGYVAGWSGGKVDVVRATATRVQTAATFIIRDVLGVPDPMAGKDEEGTAAAPARRNPASMPTLRGWSGIDEIGYAIETGYWDASE